MRWPTAWARARCRRLCGVFFESERAAHLETKPAADEQEGDVVQRVGIALAQFVGPDDERVVEQAAGAAGFGRVGQLLDR